MNHLAEINREKRHRRLRLARLKGSHTKAEWAGMKEFFKICVRCEGASNLINIEKDHIVPIYQGGSDSIRNLQPLCAKCNCSKTADTTDYRISFCKKHNLQMPKEWDSNG